MESEGLARLAATLGRLATEENLPGVRELFAALSDERARRFVRWLTDEHDGKVSDAAAAMQRLVQRQGGEVILRHIVREIFFGTESVSLAALALLASQAGRDSSDSFPGHAARAIDGLADEDAAAFLFVLAHPVSVSVENEWRPACSIEVVKAVQSEPWAPVVALYGVNEERLVAAIAEHTRRRLLLPDVAGARWAGGPLCVHFHLSRDSVRYYGLLHRAFEIAQPTLLAGLGLKQPSAVDALWAGRLAPR